MNVNDLYAEIARCGLTVPKLAERIKLDKKTLYSRLKGETSFKQPEIAKISEVLDLSKDKIFAIFFADSVSQKKLQQQPEEVRKLDKLRFIADSGTEYRVMVSESAYKTVQDIAKTTGLSAKAVATKMINFAARNVEIVYGEEE